MRNLSFYENENTFYNGYKYISIEQSIENFVDKELLELNRKINALLIEFKKIVNEKVSNTFHIIFTKNNKNSIESAVFNNTNSSTDCIPQVIAEMYTGNINPIEEIDVTQEKLPVLKNVYYPKLYIGKNNILSCIATPSTLIIPIKDIAESFIKDGKEKQIKQLFSNKIIPNLKQWLDKLSEVFNTVNRVNDGSSSSDEDIKVLDLKSIMDPSIVMLEKIYNELIRYDGKYNMSAEEIQEIINYMIEQEYARTKIKDISSHGIYKSTIANYLNMIEKEKTQSFKQNFKTLLNLLGGFFSRGYVFENGILIKKIEIKPESCFKSNQLRTIKPEYRKYYLKNLYLSAESVFDMNFYCKEANHPNVNGSSVCIGDLAGKWNGMKTRLTSLTNKDIEKFLSEVEESLMIPNLDSSYFGISDEQMSKFENNDQVLLSNDSAKTSPKTEKKWRVL